MQDFAAIDFETANNERSSVCSVGVVIVRGGEMVDTFYSLIKPEPEYYSYWCSRVHGLCCEDTEDAPVFPEVWKQIEPLIGGLPLVAHNSPFDEGCLKAVFRVYQMDYPGYEFHDTLCAARRKFPQVGEPPTAYRCCRLRLSAEEPSQRLGRCRGGGLDSEGDFVNSLRAIPWYVQKMHMWFLILLIIVLGLLVETVDKA